MVTSTDHWDLSYCGGYGAYQSQQHTSDVGNYLTVAWLFGSLLSALGRYSRPRMVPTVSRSMSSLMSVMVKTSMMTLMPLPLRLFFTPRIGMRTTLWVTNFARRGAGQLVLLHFLVEFDI